MPWPLVVKAYRERQLSLTAVYSRAIWPPGGTEGVEAGNRCIYLHEHIFLYLSECIIIILLERYLSGFTSSNETKNHAKYIGNYLHIFIDLSIKSIIQNQALKLLYR